MNAESDVIGPQVDRHADSVSSQEILRDSDLSAEHESTTARQKRVRYKAPPNELLERGRLLGRQGEGGCAGISADIPTLKGHSAIIGSATASSDRESRMYMAGGKRRI